MPAGDSVVIATDDPGPADGRADAFVDALLTAWARPACRDGPPRGTGHVFRLPRAAFEIAPGLAHAYGAQAWPGLIDLRRLVSADF